LNKAENQLEHISLSQTNEGMIGNVRQKNDDEKSCFLDIAIVSCLLWDLLKCKERSGIILSTPDNDVLLTLQWVLV